MRYWIFPRVGPVVVLARQDDRGYETQRYRPGIGWVQDEQVGAMIQCSGDFAPLDDAGLDGAMARADQFAALERESMAGS